MPNPFDDDAFNGNDDQIDALKNALRDFIDLARRAVQCDVLLADEFDQLTRDHGIGEED